MWFDMESNKDLKELPKLLNLKIDGIDTIEEQPPIDDDLQCHRIANPLPGSKS